MSGGSTTVGSINVVMTGDAVPLEQAITKTVSKLATVEDRSESAAAAVAAISNRVDELRAKKALLTKVLDDAANATQRDEAKVAALRQELEATTASLQRLTGAQHANFAAMSAKGRAALAATGGLDRFRDAADKLDDRAGKLQTAIGGLSSAFGTSAGRVGDLVGGVSDLAMSFKAGGPLLSGLVAVGTAVAAAVSYFVDLKEKAAEAAAAVAKDFADALQRIKDINTEIQALASGQTVEIVKQRLVVEERSAAARAAVAEFGGAERYSRFAGYETRGVQMNVADSEAYAKATEALKQFAVANSELTAMLKREGLARHLAGGDDEPPAAASGRSNSGLQGLVTARVTAVENVETAPGLLKGTVLQATLSALPPFAGQVRLVGDALDELGMELETTSGSFAALEAQLREDERRRSQAAMVAVTGAVETVATGGFSAGGAAAGGAIGTVIDAATGGATGGLGSVIGSIIGGILGKLLDELIGVLAILTPVMDALALVVSALAPIFMVVGVLLEAVAGTIVALVPILAAVAEPVAALLLVVVRIVEALLPFVNILLLGVGVIVAFLEVITIGVQWLDTNFFRPLASAAANLYNGFVAAYNAFIDFVRTWPGFAEFGIKMNGISTHIEDTIGGFATSLDEIGAVMGETSAATREAGRSMANVPSWYRVPLAEYRASEGGGRKNPIDGLPGRGGTVIQGPVTFVMSTPDVEAAIRKKLMLSRGTPNMRRLEDEAN